MAFGIGIGIGGMVGGGIFAVLGEAVSLAHGATPLAFLAAGCLALLTAYSYAKLSVAYPSQGGTVVFIHRAFGLDLLTGSLNAFLWCCYLVTISVYAVAFGLYGKTFFSPDVQTAQLEHILISIGIIGPLLINLFSADLVSKYEFFIVVIKLLLLLLVVFAGFGSIDASKIDLDPSNNSLNLIVSGMVIFVAYEGFELISNAAQDVKNPSVTLPRAYYGSVILVIIMYIAVAAVTVGSVSEADIQTAKDYALAQAALPSLGQTGFTLVAIAAVLATFSAINAAIYGNARLGYILARDGELPALLSKQRGDQPAAGVIVMCVLTLLMANLTDLTAIAIIGSAGFLLVFTAVNAAAMKAAREIGANRAI